MAFLRFHYGLKVDELNEEDQYKLWCEFVYVKEQIGEIKKTNE